MNYFQNEAEVMRVGGLEIQNRTDRVTLGSIDITRDEEGLQLVRSIENQLTLIREVLLADRDAGHLPKKISLVPPSAPENIFGMVRPNDKKP